MQRLSTDENVPHLHDAMETLLDKIRKNPTHFKKICAAEEELIQAVLQLAKDGDIDCQYYIACLQRYDKTDANHVHYHAYLEMAANQGHIKANFDLGLHQLSGQFGYQKDIQQAALVFTRILNHRDLQRKVSTLLTKHSEVHLAVKEWENQPEEKKAHLPRRGFFTGKMTEEEYKHAIEHPKLDVSDFILITSYFLKIKLGYAFDSNERQTLQLAYFKMQYDQCISVLQTLVERNKDLLKPSLQDYLRDALKHKREIELHCNHSRRYFETRLQQFNLSPKSNFYVSAVEQHAIETAFQDAEEYAKKVCLKYNTQKSLPSNLFLNQTAAQIPWNEKNLQLLNESIERGNEIPQAFKKEIMTVAYTEGLLHKCIRSCLTGLLEFLLKNNMDPNASHAKTTPLEEAMKIQNFGAALLLIKHGAEYRSVDEKLFANFIKHFMMMASVQAMDFTFLQTIVKNYLAAHKNIAVKPEWIAVLQTLDDKVMTKHKMKKS